MTYFEAQKKAEKILCEAGITEYTADARLLLLYASGKTPAMLLLVKPEEMPESIEKRFFELIAERAERKPLQYITGTTGFCGFDFFVNENVLIPRFDTEILVLEAIKYSEGKKVLDMCTGSGCIAVSTALLGNTSDVTAADISEKALEVAKINAENLNAGFIKFVQSDMFSNIEGEFDLILSNPPYVTGEEYKDLEPEVRIHEPEGALVAPEKGLFFYKILAAEASKRLTPGGRIIVETGDRQGTDVSNIFADAGLTDIKVIKDLAGLDRVVSARKNG